MIEHKLKLRVRYGETDQMGYAYYGVYATYCEVARVELLRAIGYRYKDLESAGYMLPVVEHHGYYKAPAKYDEELTIVVQMTERPSVRFHFKYQFFNEEKILIHEAETRLVIASVQTGKACRPPKKIVELFDNHFVN